MSVDKKSNRNEKTSSKTKAPSPWFTLAILSSSLLVLMFSETMLLPAIPEIMHDFKVPYSTSAWVFSAYLVAAAVMTPIAGKLSDIYGKKKILLILLAIYVAGITVGGFANSISFLLVTRIIQGVGLASVPAAFSLLRDSFPPQKLPIAIGVFGSAYSGGSIVGLLVGASIIQNLGWHATFFSLAPVAVIMATIIAKFVRDGSNNKDAQLQLLTIKGTEDTKKNLGIDLKGSLSLSVTISSFLIALTLIAIGVNSESFGKIAGAFIASAASLAVFVFIERKTAFPLLDLRLLKHKILLPTYVILMFTGVTMFLVYPSIVQLVRSPEPFGFGGTAIDASRVQLPFMIMFLVFSSASAVIIRKIGNVKPTIFGGIISVIGAVGLLAFHSSELQVSVNLAIIATGLSLTSTAAWNIISTFSPKEFMGISVGVGAMLFFVGMAIGPALAGLFVQSNISDYGVTSYPARESYNWIFSTAGLLAIVRLMLSVLLRKRIPEAADDTVAVH